MHFTQKMLYNAFAKKCTQSKPFLPNGRRHMFFPCTWFPKFTRKICYVLKGSSGKPPWKATWGTYMRGRIWPGKPISKDHHFTVKSTICPTKLVYAYILHLNALYCMKNSGLYCKMAILGAGWFPTLCKMGNPTPSHSTTLSAPQFPLIPQVHQEDLVGS